MRIGCIDCCSCLSYCWNNLKYSFSVAVVDVHQIASCPDALQKACILVHSIIHGINLIRHTNYLPRLVHILDHAQAFDFYGICRLPHYFIHPYSHEQIDENLLLSHLTTILQQNWNPEDDTADQAIQGFARSSLKRFLETIAEEEIAFPSEEKMREGLQNWFILRNVAPSGRNLADIDLRELSISLKKTSWLVAITDASFILADIICIPDFLGQWHLIHLPSFEGLQQLYPSISYSPLQSFDDFVRASMSIGFALQAIRSAAILLSQSVIDPTERSHGRWVLAASVAELIFNTSILRRTDPRFVTLFAFCAKLFGLIAFLKTPKPVFFPDDS